MLIRLKINDSSKITLDYSGNCVSNLHACDDSMKKSLITFYDFITFWGLSNDKTKFIEALKNLEFDSKYKVT